ncbi:MAG: hypothetical protein HEEMFOPI_01688 [Holosporales bacterium]
MARLEIMDCSIKTLHAFYHSPLGDVVRTVIEKKVSHFLNGDQHHRVILGVGYAHPFLSPSIIENNTVLSFMPDSIGACVWPTAENNKVALVHDWMLPLANQSVDVICIVHALEFVQQTEAFFHELWRILKKDGKIILIAPNRRGLWSRFEHTPFGFGRPYTMTQAQEILSNYGFITTQKERFLTFPPINHPSLLKGASLFDKIAPFFLKNFSGAIGLVAEKKTLVLSSASLLQPLNMPTANTYAKITTMGKEKSPADKPQAI